MKTFKKSALIILLMATAAPAFALEVEFEEDNRLPIVYINVAAKTGSVSDPQGKSGLTDFMGEMLLRGTKLRKKQQLDATLDQIGASLGVETRAEAMILRGAVLAKNLDKFLELVAEVLTQPSFDRVEMTKLRNQKRSSYKEELGNDRATAQKKFERYLFRNHPYGNPPEGNGKEFDKITLADVQKHYDEIVRDQLLVIVGTGDASTSRIKEWGRKLAESRAGGQTRTAVPQPENLAQRELMIIDKPNRTQTQIFGGWVGVRMTDPDYFALYIGNHAFGGGSFLARLMQEIRVKKGWSYGAYSNFRHGTQPRSWMFNLFPASKDAADALKLTLQLINELKEKGITEAEFNSAKQSLTNNAGFSYNTPKKRVENILLERTLNLPHGFMKTYAERMASVTLSQVNAALKRFVQPEHLFITVLGTEKGLREPLANAAGIPAQSVKVVDFQSWPN
ncbi:MAG: M16 family metallopeptidase [Bacteriovoracia bacterium]